LAVSWYELIEFKFPNEYFKKNILKGIGQNSDPKRDKENFSNMIKVSI
jgi:hypothetical protein